MIPLYFRFGKTTMFHSWGSFGLAVRSTLGHYCAFEDGQNRGVVVDQQQLVWGRMVIGLGLEKELFARFGGNGEMFAKFFEDYLLSRHIRNDWDAIRCFVADFHQAVVVLWVSLTRQR